MNLLENPYRYAYGYMSEGHVIAQHIVLDKCAYNPVQNKYVYDGYIYDPTIGESERYALPVGVFEIPAALKSHEVDAVFRIMRVFCEYDHGRYYRTRVRLF